MDKREHGTGSPDFEEAVPSEALRVRRLADLHDAGLTRRGVERELRTGSIERVRRGIYVPPTDDDEVRWRQVLAANMAHGGRGSALSHRCAAYFHRFDGYGGLPIAERYEDLSIATA